MFSEALSVYPDHLWCLIKSEALSYA